MVLASKYTIVGDLPFEAAIQKIKREQFFSELALGLFYICLHLCSFSVLVSTRKLGSEIYEMASVLDLPSRSLTRSFCYVLCVPIWVALNLGWEAFNDRV